MSIQKICAGFETTLAAKLLAGGTSFSLSSHLNKKGVELSGEYGFILGEGTAVEEWCYGTVVSGVVTIIKRGLDPEDPNVEVSALKFDHDRGSSVKITDYPFLGLVRQYLGGEKDLPAPLKYATHHTPTEDTELIDKQYAQELFTGEIGTASPSAAGIIFTDQDMGNKPVAKTIIAYEQATPDMTIKVTPFNLAEIDKHVSFAGGNSPTFVAPVTDPRIDILVYDIAASALEVRVGAENVSPVTPALENGDIAIAKIYHRVGETSIKNSSDGTNGYIMALYSPAVTRNDILLNTDTTVKKFETLPAYEDLAVGDLLKPYDDNGIIKLRKISGIKNTEQSTTTLYNISSSEYAVLLKLTNNLFISGNSYNNESFIFAVNITDAGVLTNGSSVTVNTGASPYTMRHAPKLIRVNDTSFIAVWQGLQANANTIFARLYTVSGTTLSAGPVVTIAVGSTGTDSYEHNCLSICNLDTDKFLLVWNLIGYDSTYTNGMVLTISGGSLVTNGVTRISSTMNNTYANAVAIKMDTNKAVVVGVYVPSSEYLRAVIVTVSGTSISVSGENNIKTLSCAQISNYRAFDVAPLGVDKFAIAYCSSTNIIGVITFSLSGTTFTEISSISATLTHNSSVPSITVLSSGELWVNYNNTLYQVFIDSTLSAAFGGSYTGDTVTKKTRYALIEFKDALNFITRMTGSTNYYTMYRRFLLDHSKFVTSANAIFLAGENVPIVDVFTGFSGLIAGLDYYINSAASGLTISSTYQKIGKAISATKIIK